MLYYHSTACFSSLKMKGAKKTIVGNEFALFTGTLIKERLILNEKLKSLHYIQKGTLYRICE